MLKSLIRDIKVSNLIQGIYDFNSKAGLLEGDMDAFKELAYVLEESFEGYEEAYNTQDQDGNRFKPGDKEYPKARQLGLSLANSIRDSFTRTGLPLPSEVQEVDKSVDAVVFHIGKLAKMGLSPAQIEEIFSVVSGCNMAKLSGPKDGLGKQLKPDGWTGPEDALQGILDKRSKARPSLLKATGVETN